MPMFILAGDFDRTVACYQAALGLARSTPEHNWLASRRALALRTRAPNAH